MLRTCGELVDEGEGLIGRHFDDCDCSGDRIKRSKDRKKEREREQEDEVEWRVVAS